MKTVWGWIQRRIDWFLVEALYQNPTALFRSRVLIGGSLFLSLVTAFLMLQYVLFIGRLPPGTIPVTVMMLGFFALPWLVRSSGSYQRPGAVITLLLMCAMPAIGLMVPTFPMPVLFLFGALPLIATFFVNATMGFFSTCTQIIAIYAIYLKNIPDLPAGLPPQFFPNYALYAGMATAITFTFAWLFERSRVWATSLLEKTLSELQLANQAKDQFLTRMSHELRTPLNAIINYSEMIKEEAQDEGLHTIEEDSKIVLQSSHHLLQLIKDVLDTTKIQAKELEYHPTTVSLHDLLGEVEQFSTQRAQDKANEFSCILETTQETLYTDPMRLQQILFNLLDNAFKFTRGGRVTLRVWDALEQIPTLYFEVKDTGQGIPQEQQTHIFDLFTQVDASTTRRHDGLGLGLPLARSLCLGLGGDIRVESQPNKGTTFTAHFPLSKISSP